MGGFEFLGTLQGFFTTLGVLIASVVGSYFAFRGKRGETQVQAAQVNTESTAKFLDGQMEFQKYVDEAVRVRVEEATADMRIQLDQLTTTLSGVQKESHEMNDIIRSRETRLWAWNNMHDREGDIPQLPEAIMYRLGLGHLINLSAFTGNTGKIPVTNDKE